MTMPCHGLNADADDAVGLHILASIRYLLRPGPPAILQHEVPIAGMLAHQQAIGQRNVGLDALVGSELTDADTVEYGAAFRVFFVGPAVVVEQDPTLLLQELVHEEECQAVDRPVLGTVDKAEIVA